MKIVVGTKKKYTEKERKWNETEMKNAIKFASGNVNRLTKAYVLSY